MNYNLTERENEILKMIVEGKSNKEIAAKLFIAITTVKYYVSSILQKTNSKNRVCAAVKGLEIFDNEKKGA